MIGLNGKRTGYEMTEEQRKRTLKDGQEAGEMLLDIEIRIGELLPAKEEALKTASTGGKREKRMEGISMKRAVHARAIARHPDIVEKVKAQARENEAKVENLLFVIWIQDQRHDYWMKVIREMKEGLEELWNHLTADVLTELWNAREKLRCQGARTDLTSGKITRSWEGYCEDIGISKRIANIWLKVFELGWEALLLSGSKEWYTPKEYIGSVYEVLSEIDLDPASCKEANQNIKAKKFYSKEDNGLSYPWKRRS